MSEAEDKRRSERVIPFVSDEEVVLVHVEENLALLAKMLDLSDVGTLVYLLVDTPGPPVGASCALSIYNSGKVIEVTSKVVRSSGRLCAFQFDEMQDEAVQSIAAKLI